MKSTLITKFCVIVVFLLVSTYVWGATYYVDADASAGGDGSLSTPWDTLSDISLSSGDTVYLDRGDTWRESLTISTANVTISAYGSGSLPIISGADYVNTWSQVGETNIYSATLNTETYVVLHNTTILTEDDGCGGDSDCAENTWDWDSNTLYVNVGAGGPGADEIQASVRDTVVDVNANGVSVLNIRGEFANGTAGVFNRVDNSITGTTFRYCGAYYFRRAGFKIQTGATLNADATIDNNTSAYGYGNGIVVQASSSSYDLSGVTVSNNTVQNIKQLDDFAYNYGITLFYVDGQTNAVEVINNTVHTIQGGYASGTVGIKLDGDTTDGCDYVKVSENKVYDIGGNGIQVESHSDHNTISYNWVTGTGTDISGTGGIAIIRGSPNNYVLCNILPGQDSNANFNIIVQSSDDRGTSDSCLIYGNTIYETAQNFGIIVKDNGSSAGLGCAENVKVKNNIVWGLSGVNSVTAFELDSDSYTGFESDYNVWGENTNTQAVRFETTSWDSLSDWQTNSSTDTGSAQDASSINSDPSFTNAAGDDFTLQRESPCIDAGVNISGYGTKLRTDSTWPSGVETCPVGNLNDIGAYEYPIWGIQ